MRTGTSSGCCNIKKVFHAYIARPIYREDVLFAGVEKHQRGKNYPEESKDCLGKRGFSC